MPKVDWTTLEIIEEWTTIDPSNSEDLEREGRKLRLLVSLTLKAHERENKELRRKSDLSNERIRRKAGLAA